MSSSHASPEPKGVSPVSGVKQKPFLVGVVRKAPPGAPPPPDLLAVGKTLQVQKVIGAPQKPDALVVLMTDDEAKQLRQRFPGLSVEEDSPLRPSQPS